MAPLKLNNLLLSSFFQTDMKTNENEIKATYLHMMALAWNVKK